MFQVFLPRWMRRAVGVAAVAVVCLLAGAGVASAQDDERNIGWFAIDLHGTMNRFGPTVEQAVPLGYTAETDLPSRGWGADAGLHVYPIRWKFVALGVGGNVLTAAGKKDPLNATTGEPTGNVSETQFRSVASQVSLNFVGSGGWSYISGGYGFSTFALSNEAVPRPASLERRATINYGAGARWAVRNHIAFSMDIRFYKLAAQEATVDQPADVASTKFVFGLGVSIR